MTPDAMATVATRRALTATVRRAFDALVERENADRVHMYNVARVTSTLGIQLTLHLDGAAATYSARIHGYPHAAEGFTRGEAIGNLLRAVMLDDPAVLWAALAPW
jgi:hypothetical protein